MKYGIKHIAMLYLLVVLSFATTGVNIYASYCACSRLADYSLTEPESCCQSHTHSACSIDLHEQDVPHESIHTEGCCNQQKISLTIDSPFVASPSLALPSLAVIYSQLLILLPTEALPVAVRDAVCRFDLIKPLLHGSGLVCFLHCYKIPDSI